ncbi:hypothetical protein AGMMS50256_10100 [Betaproteobacteria bacterium]|nr:hypothetical protein AGMMS50256_10100 [Betaproteobacteria bacterium]
MLKMTQRKNSETNSRGAFSGEFPAELVDIAARRQSGAVLLIALVVLIAMTLSALALIKSVNTTNLIAGNLAFRESAVLSSERSTELAFNDWIRPHSVAGDRTLYNDSPGNAYLATRADPPAGTNWDTFWNATLTAQARMLATDVAGNTVWYVIHRLCDGPGDPGGRDPSAPPPDPSAPPTGPLTANCSKSPKGGSDGSFGIPDKPGAPLDSPLIYYRITTRVAGPRNTVVYTQTTIAI